MNAYDLSFEGLVSSGTFYVNSTDATTLKERDVVAITADGTVGFGTDGDPILGVVLAIEKTGNLAAHGVVATVQRRCSFEDIATTNTTANAPVVGGLVCTDGTGKVRKMPNVTVDITNGIALKRGNVQALVVDTTNKLASIWID